MLGREVYGCGMGVEGTPGRGGQLVPRHEKRERECGFKKHACHRRLEQRWREVR